MKPDNRASDDDQHLETSEGKLIKLDTPQFLKWLETNNSFRFEAGFGGENSYRARKETLSGGDYWYAVKKVSGKLHKKFIGKSEEITHSRLVEISKLIKQPPKKQATPKTQQPQFTDNQQLEQRLAALEAMLYKDLEPEPINTPEITESNLEAENRELTNQIQELTNENQELTNEIDRLTNYKKRFPYSVDVLKQLKVMYMRDCGIESGTDEYKALSKALVKFVKFIEANPKPEYMGWSALFNFYDDLND